MKKINFILLLINFIYAYFESVLKTNTKFEVSFYYLNLAIISKVSFKKY